MSAIAFEDGERKVVVEDDGKTVYAYLLVEGEISADVWLANRDRPGSPEWREPDAQERMPFLNPLPFVDATRLGMEPVALDGLAVVWQEVEVTLVDQDGPLARLTPGLRPGSSRYAAKDGPLARTFVSGWSRPSDGC